jgi:hypothetical protein
MAGAITLEDISELDLPKYLERKGFKLFVIGKSGSGKSTFVKWLFYLLKDKIPAAVAISESESANQFFSDFIPRLFIYESFSSNILNNVVERQKQIIKKKCPNPDILVVADDCFSDPRKMQEPPTPWIFKTGRHYGINYIILMQYVMDLKPDTRNQVDGVFLFNEQNEQTKTSLWNNFASSIPYNEFNRLLSICTEEYGAMFINLSSGVSKSDWKQFISRVRAPLEIPHFVFGSAEYQKYSESRNKCS